MGDVVREEERGSVLMPVSLLLLLFSGVALGMSLVVRLELLVGDRFVQSAQALLAADAGLALASSEMRGLASWTPVLSGTAVSARSEGGVTGAKAVVGGGTVLVCCGRTSLLERLTAESAVSPVPARRAAPWRPYLWTSFGTVAAHSVRSRLFLVVFVQDDEEDGDGEGGADSNGRVIVRAEAAHADGYRRAVEAVLARVPADPATGAAQAVRLLQWREVR